MIKICAISDLHGTLPVIGQCDVVCICGDVFPLEIQRVNTECELWFNTIFADWIDTLPCEKVSSFQEITTFGLNVWEKLKYLTR